MPEPRAFWDSARADQTGAEGIVYRRKPRSWSLEFSGTEVARVEIVKRKVGFFDVPDLPYDRNAELWLGNQEPSLFTPIYGGWINQDLVTASPPTLMFKGRLLRAGPSQSLMEGERKWMRWSSEWRDSWIQRGAMYRVSPEPHAFQDPDFRLILGGMLLIWSTEVFETTS